MHYTEQESLTDYEVFKMNVEEEIVKINRKLDEVLNVLYDITEEIDEERQDEEEGE
jgi:hypothetical protein